MTWRQVSAWGPPRRLWCLASAFLALMGAWNIVGAQSASAATEQVALRLLASHNVVQPGQKLLVGVEQRIAPHWHTYWRNPGDSGEATSIAWKLPDSARAGPILWPTPQRIDGGPVTNFGYSDRVVLLTELVLPTDLKVGTATRISAHVSWLVCKEECIPQEADVALALPVSATSPPSPHAASLDIDLRALPQAPSWSFTARRDNARVVLTWPVLGESDSLQSATFYPQNWGWIQHHAAQALHQQAGQWQLTLSPGEAPPKLGDAFEGVVVLQSTQGRRSVAVSAPVQSPLANESADSLSLWLALLLALAGGAVLNLMPCVFPVLSIKALSLVQQAHGSRSVARRHGLAYTAGALVSFALLALILIALKAAGSQVGWGFQFQSPVFVGGVAAVLFAVGLSLSGVFSIGVGITGLGSDAASRPGYAGSFFSGVLAAVVATPCTAPFMGAAVAFALAQPAWQLLLVFLGLGLGLAAPYLVLSWWPTLQRWLPHPGVWMETLKQALAFPMYGAAIWLVWVIAQQSGAQGVLQVLSSLALLAFAAWSYQRVATASPGTWRRTGHAAALLSTGLALTCVAQLPPASEPDTVAAALADFEPYTPARLDALRAQGKPVFVNLTAAWCISCLVNERVALSQPEVRQALRDGGVTYLKGDWTQKDPRITELLQRHGRSGVPLYLYYPSGADALAVVLPQILTPGLVTAVLRPTSPPTT